ncbi:hypothetical protein FNW52_16085 [Flavobacterium sp. ZT3R18]|nr:hypothetical protein FNW52_16085 [Flavobacterium sp. ZT3R18]
MVILDKKNINMISKSTQKQIIEIWEDYQKTNKKVLDTKGNIIKDIDENRIDSIKDIKDIIDIFMIGDYFINEFKTSLDSYNKRNNYWGFTATKGQMFFNQLTKTNESNLEPLTVFLKEVISEPLNLEEALHKIEKLEKFANAIFKSAPDKRKAPNPGSVGYFLSYFWQIYNPGKWPVFYTSLVNGFKELGIWEDHKTQKENYEYFYNLNQEVKNILEEHSGRYISNWEAEHSFWNFTGKPKVEYKKAKPEIEIIEGSENKEEITFKANFDLNDYLIPRVAKLIELGNSNDKSAAAKGSDFEKMVAETFKLLGFETEIFGQGSGRNPDAIIKFREEHTAFIVDAKAYNEGYVMGRDDRAIREYIANYCPKLRKDGFTKIGFIIVSNSFKTNLQDFVNEITWNTDIKRFIPLTTEALLYCLGYKTKDDKVNLSVIIEHLTGLNGVITAQNIIQRFDDI